MFVWFLALRYLVARPVSYLGIVAIGLGVGALIVVLSVMNGFLEETRDLVRGTTADIVVFPIQDGTTRVVPRDEILEVVNAQEGVAGATGRLVRPAVYKLHTEQGDRGRMRLPDINISNSENAGYSQVLVLGVDPDREMAVSGFTDYLRDVRSPDLKVDDVRFPFRIHPGLVAGHLRNAGLPRILVGEDLMLAMGLHKGEALDIVTLPDEISLEGGQGAKFASDTFVIAGSFRTGHYDFDTGHMFVMTEAFLDWSGTAMDVSEVYIAAIEGTDLDALRDRLDAALDEKRMYAEVKTWRDRHAIMLGAVENERTILAFVLGLFVLLTCTITFMMLVMMVQEKVRDIGILSAMGAPSVGIGRIFAVCGALISAVGGLFGLGVGTWVALNANPVKDWIETTFGIEIFRKNVYAFTDIPTSVHHQLNAGIVALTVVFSILICLYPAWRAARLDPVAALRHE